MTNTGFRLLNRRKLIDSQIDSVTKEVLVGKFGKPDRIWTTNKGFQYIYFVRNSQVVDKIENGEIVFIYFLFNAKTNLLDAIGEDAMP